MYLGAGGAHHVAMKLSGWIVSAALAALAGCASGSPAVTSQTTAPSPTSLTEAQFLELAGGMPFFADAERSNPQSFAGALCTVFDPSKGGDPSSLWREAIGASVNAGLDAEDAGRFLVYAVATYCPQEYKYLPGA